MCIPKFVNLFAIWITIINMGNVDAVTNVNSRPSRLSAFQSSSITQDQSFCCTRRKKVPFLQTSMLKTLVSARGGAIDSEYGEDSEDFYDSEEESEDDEDLFGDFDEDNVDDFKEDNTVDRIIEEYQRTPPITKAYLTSSLVVTLFGYFMTNNEFPPLLSLDWNKVFKGGQIWRPFTAFLNLGSLGLIGYPMTVHFVHQYMSFLERLAHNKPYDFWIMILFGMTSMLVGYPIMKMSPRFLGHNLSTFLVYIWSRMFEGVDVGVFEFIHIKAELLPWFLLAQVRQN